MWNVFWIAAMQKTPPEQHIYDLHIRSSLLKECCTSSDNDSFENLLLVLSDGRNIFSEGKTKANYVYNLTDYSILLLILQRVFLVYIIIDSPANKNSILDIKTMEMLPDKKTSIKSYLDDLPFPYYAIVNHHLPLPPHQQHHRRRLRFEIAKNVIKCKPINLDEKYQEILTSAFGDVYDAVAFLMTSAFEAGMPCGRGTSRANKAYSTSMCLMKGEDKARNAVSGSSSS
uniref:Uncharacterized protein n=1 Tax=Glossina austeni TaxID=7395 RepID=A0A1A9UJ26_GLOAU